MKRLSLSTKTGQMRRFNLDAAQLPNPVGGGRWQPVRFISVCAAGHLCEFPWKQWIGCQCADDGNLFLTDRGGSELTSIRVECRACPAGSPGRQGRTLAGTTIKPNVALGEQSEFQKAGIPCPGDRPWLGDESAQRQVDFIEIVVDAHGAILAHDPVNARVKEPVWRCIPRRWPRTCV